MSGFGINSRYQNNTNNSNFQGGGESTGGSIRGVRVKNIVLDESSFGFEKYGENDSLGGINYEFIEKPEPGINVDLFAYPLFPHLQSYPIVNEIVYIISLPDWKVQFNASSVKTYYFTPINLQKSVNNNIIPNVGVNYPNPQKQNQKNTQQIEAGNTQKQDIPYSPKIPIEYTLPIRDLRLFDGDVALQGRWGNSIHFTRTMEPYSLNEWSQFGNKEDGKPLTIIRNGQEEITQGKYKPTSEKINDDKSSIWLTNTQKIPLNTPEGIEYKSYGTKAPQAPNEYVGDQIILNSGRLTFNSKSDSILLSSQKTINLNSIDSVNIDTNSFKIYSPLTYIGDVNDNNTQPAVLGDELVKVLTDIITDINLLNQTLGTEIGNLGVPLIATNLSSNRSQLDLSTSVEPYLKEILQPSVRIIQKLNSKNNNPENTPPSDKPLGEALVIDGKDDPNKAPPIEENTQRSDNPQSDNWVNQKGKIYIKGKNPTDTIYNSVSNDEKTSAKGINANKLRATLLHLGYQEKGIEIDNGGDITPELEKLASAFFTTIKEKYPNYKIRVTGGNDYFHHQTTKTVNPKQPDEKILWNPYSLHTKGNGLDFVVWPSKEEDLDNIVNILRGYVAGDTQFRFIDEYRKITKNKTKNHFHISYGGEAAGYREMKKALALVESGQIEKYIA